MAFVALNRYPDNPLTPRPPELERWHTALVRAVNGLLGIGTTGGVLTVGDGNSTSGVTLNGTAITSAQASQVNIQGFAPGNTFLAMGAYFNGSAWIATYSSSVILYQLNDVFNVFVNTGLTAGLPFTPALVFTINNGGLLSTTGQVAFPPTQNPSSGANILDDYEEGTWTPVDASGAGLGFTTVDGSYTKIGNSVRATGHAIYPVTASGLGAVVGGLPFTTAAHFDAVTTGFNTSGITVLGVTLSATTNILLSTNAGAAVTNAQMSGVSYRFTTVYQAAA